MVADQPYLSSARTLADSRVLMIPAQRVRATFGQEVAFARVVARELAFAYRTSVKKLKGYVARSSIERLANWILTEAQKDSSHANIIVPFDRGTLASHIGTTRENLSRNLAQLTEHGVRIRGREIVIDRSDQLEAFARPQRLIDDPEPCAQPDCQGNGGPRRPAPRHPNGICFARTLSSDAISGDKPAHAQTVHCIGA